MTRHRPLLAVMLAALVATMLVGIGLPSDAADPSSGTVSPAEPTTTWVGDALTPVQPGATSGETEACPPERDPASASCDYYTITVEGVDDDLYAEFAGTLTLSVEWADDGDDYDIGLYRPGGVLPVSAAATSANPEIVSVSNPTGTYELRVAPFLVTNEPGYDGTAKLTLDPLDAIVDPVSPGFQAYTAERNGTDVEEDLLNTPVAYDGSPVAFLNSDVGHGALEPTIGVDPEGNAYVAALGRDGLSDLGTTIQRSNDNGQSWQDITPRDPATGTTVVANSNDPYIYVDDDTGNIYSFDLQALTQSSLLISTDGGESFTPGGPDPTGVVQDHQTLTTGVVPEASGLSTVVGDEIVYYCFNRVAESTCSRSLDNGLTFARTGEPAFPGVDPGNYGEQLCGGLHGHIETDEDGFLLLPKGHCAQPWLGVSEDAGTTWRVTRVADMEFPEQQASVSADTAGNYFYAWYDGNGQPYLAVSRDRGMTWEEPMMIAPPGVGEVQWPTVYAGDEGRVAVGFPCTRAQGESATSLSRPWDYCMVMSENALDDDPVWLSNIANEVGDPIHRGECPGRCGNMLDFLDVTAAPPSGGGNVWAVYTDTCTDQIFDDGSFVGDVQGEEGTEFPQCNIDPTAVGFDGNSDNASGDEAGFAVRQVCGPSLWELPDIDEACQILTSNAPVGGGVVQVPGGADVGRVTILGGEVAVARSVDGQVNARGVQVDRIAGADRYETAAKVARDAFSAGSDTVYIATGELFPDGLSGAPAAAKEDAPLLLTQKDNLPDATAAALRELAPDEVILVGGPNAISDDTQRAIEAVAKIGTRRIEGATRYETAAEVAAASYPDGASTVVVATGEDFPDALAGAAAAARLHAPVLLTRPDVLSEAAADQLANLDPDRVLLLGGTTAISADVADAIADAAGVTPQRLAGETRYDTAVEISTEVFPSARNVVFLATGEAFADALSGAAAAARLDAPVLLTRRTQLASETGDEIVRLLRRASRSTSMR